MISSTSTRNPPEGEVAQEGGRPGAPNSSGPSVAPDNATTSRSAGPRFPRGVAVIECHASPENRASGPVLALERPRYRCYVGASASLGVVHFPGVSTSRGAVDPG